MCPNGSMMTIFFIASSYYGKNLSKKNSFVASLAQKMAFAQCDDGYYVPQQLHDDTASPYYDNASPSLISMALYGCIHNNNRIFLSCCMECALLKSPFHAVLCMEQGLMRSPIRCSPLHALSRHRDIVLIELLLMEKLETPLNIFLVCVPFESQVCWEHNLV